MKGIMKKLGLIALAFVLMLTPVFMFSGCGNKDDGSSKPATPAETPAEITKLTLEQAETKLKVIVGSIPSYDGESEVDVNAYKSLPSYDGEFVMSRGTGFSLNKNGTTSREKFQVSNQNGVIQEIDVDRDGYHYNLVDNNKYYRNSESGAEEVTQKEHYDSVIRAGYYTGRSVSDFYELAGLKQLSADSGFTLLGNSIKSFNFVKEDVYKITYGVAAKSNGTRNEVSTLENYSMDIEITFNVKSEVITNVVCSSIETTVYLGAGTVNSTPVQAGDVAGWWAIYNISFNFETPKFEVPQECLDAIRSLG